MKLIVLLGLPITGGLIEAFFVIVLNLLLIFYCSSRGIYDIANSVLEEGRLVIFLVNAVFVGAFLYPVAYTMLLMGPGNCSSSKANGIPLWYVRLLSICWQLIHGVLFIVLVSTRYKSCVILALLLYLVTPIGVGCCYWLRAGLKKLYGEIQEECKEAEKIDWV